MAMLLSGSSSSSSSIFEGPSSMMRVTLVLVVGRLLLSVKVRVLRIEGIDGHGLHLWICSEIRLVLCPLFGSLGIVRCLVKTLDDEVRWLETLPRVGVHAG